ncbi:hypothetical protein [Flavobacterium wongokense]|uniref:hypothetical protein n=1 Tax=Flavobacterium wongokense TaxID=2910674 RepID=UPI001F18B34E|nr:hypothetical protein [Flavobacterium sp. WG47]MCF6133371.1 hypothetical protein [Flavobacterium sp. WG47]
MKAISKIIIALGFISLFSCEDIIEEDITNDTVIIVSPQNNQDIYSNVVNFQWNELDGADKYRVQVYSNSSVIVDSLVSQNHLSMPMTAGDYQWRIRGENFAYNSNYTFNYNFSVIATTDLTNQQTILNSPSDNFYTNNANVILNWQSLAAASTYSFELINVTNGESIVNQQSNLTATSLTLNSTILANDAQYKWKIKAVNTTSQTAFSFRNFYLDRSNPNTPTNTLPATDATYNANQQINFSWGIPADVGTIQSTISYVIEFSNNINFTSILQSSNATTASFQQSFATSGDYYWRVKAKDLAGNTGLYSTPFRFTIN